MTHHSYVPKNYAQGGLNIPDQQEQLALALAEVKAGKSIRESATKYGIPKSTLFTYTKSPPNKQQEKQLLNEEEENELVLHIQALIARHFVVDKQWIVDAAQEIVDSKSGDTRKIGYHWIDRFMKRHAGLLKNKWSHHLDFKRLNNTKTEYLQQHFDLFERLQTQFQLTPRCIFNMDETGRQFIPKSIKIICSTKDKKSYMKAQGDKGETISIIECISMDGTALQPSIIFKGKYLMKSWFQDIREWRDSFQPNFHVSENGWTDSEIGIVWLDSFIQQVAHIEGRKLLVVDGHSSHLSWQFLQRCFANQIELFNLIPHTTHIAQPLDLACFSANKTHFTNAIKDHMRTNVKALTKADFLKLYAQAWTKTFTESNIASAWREAGLWPWDPSKVLRKCTPIAIPTTDIPPEGFNALSSDLFDDDTPQGGLIARFKARLSRYRTKYILEKREHANTKIQLHNALKKTTTTRTIITEARHLTSAQAYLASYYKWESKCILSGNGESFHVFYLDWYRSTYIARRRAKALLISKYKKMVLTNIRKIPLQIEGAKYIKKTFTLALVRLPAPIAATQTIDHKPTIVANVKAPKRRKQIELSPVRKKVSRRPLHDISNL